uniref:Uncharacterized protein n=1 Tax=Oryza punctata TaxID=4537 RepID=A0A0E0LJR1_ORYPU
MRRSVFFLLCFHLALVIALVVYVPDLVDGRVIQSNSDLKPADHNPQPNPQLDPKPTPQPDPKQNLNRIHSLNQNPNHSVS